MKKTFLQEYVDHKLNSIRADMDDLSDYLENYTDDTHKIELKDLKKWNINPEQFIYKFKPSISEIRKAIEKSDILHILAERYKKSVIRDIPKDILNNIIKEDKADIRDEFEEEKEFDVRESAIRKLKKANLTKEEKEVLNLSCL